MHQCCFKEGMIGLPHVTQWLELSRLKVLNSVARLYPCSCSHLSCPLVRTWLLILYCSPIQPYRLLVCQAERAAIISAKFQGWWLLLDFKSLIALWEAMISFKDGKNTSTLLALLFFLIVSLSLCLCLLLLLVLLRLLRRRRLLLVVVHGTSKFRLHRLQKPMSFFSTGLSFSVLAWLCLYDEGTITPTTTTTTCWNTSRHIKSETQTHTRYLLKWMVIGGVLVSGAFALSSWQANEAMSKYKHSLLSHSSSISSSSFLSSFIITVLHI